jgi:tetratricopeptide (TPR) repeat protein
VAGALAAAGSLGLALSGARLGHYSTEASIRQELERTLTTERCEVVYAPSITEYDARLLGRDCDAHVRELERWFETSAPERIRVFLFESEAQKGRLMGAAHTYIAKPWRREIYLQHARYPHPVLGHELAHVVAGSFGAGPFRVSGPLGGLLPDPGRIEGVATAATPGDESELGLAEEARAMRDLGLLPSLDSVFRLSFLGENSSKAYSVAGAFVEWMRRAHGARAVRGWYAGEPLESLTGGKDLRALERDWLASLDAAVVSPAVLETARARFDRPSVFGRKCPHVVDRALGDAHGRLGQGDVQGARAGFDRVLSLDETHFNARLALGSCSLRAGDEADARRRFQQLSEDESLHRLLRLAAEEALGDLELSSGNAVAARARYSTVAASVVDEGRLRTLDVKAFSGSERAREAIAALLVGDPRWGRDVAEATARLGEWAAAEPDAGLPEYLLGRGAYNAGRWDEAARRLDRALERRLTLRRVRAETLRLRLVVACAREERSRARDVLAEYSLLELEPSAREAVQRFGRRCGLN